MSTLSNCRTWNDHLPTDEDRTRLIRPLVPLVVNTKASDAIENLLEDIHGSAAYRRHLAGVLVARTARRAWERAVA